jgi:hypothetical protein
MQLEDLTPVQREKIAVHLRRFQRALREEKAFDERVAASIARLFARNPAFRQRLAELDARLKQQGPFNP